MTTEEQILSTLQAMQAQQATMIQLMSEIGETGLGYLLGGFAALLVATALSHFFNRA